MASFSELRVTPIAWTQFEPPAHVPWKPDLDAEDGESLAEFAGRACYQSWSKPNPATASNAGYLQHILSVGHMSVLEHGVVTFYLEGISRSLTHEFVRHRHFSYSQLSQRYVNSSDTEFVMPPEAEGDNQLGRIIRNSSDSMLLDYDDIVEIILRRLAGEPGSATEKRKRARQTARAVLGNFTETKIVVTGNYRAWRHFIAMRAAAGADTEIRRCAIAILHELKILAPSVFSDFKIDTHTDGTEIASSVLRTEV